MKIVLLLLISLAACSEQKKIVENSPATKESVRSETVTPSVNTQSAQPNSLSAQKKEIKPLINFYNLAKKSIAEIEKIYGKPSTIDTKFVQSKNGEYRIYDKTGERFLQVDYFDGKATAIYLEIPEEFQTESPEETIKLCGLNEKLSSSETQKSGFWWGNPSPPFFRVNLNKYNDSGLFYSCEAHIKVN